MSLKTIASALFGVSLSAISFSTAPEGRETIGVQELNIEQIISEENQRKINEIREMIKFGEEELGMDFNGAYEKVNLSAERSYFYFLYVSEPDEITFSSQIGRKISLKNNKKLAEKLADKYSEKGYHVFISMGASIGNNSGSVPITRSMIDSPLKRLAYLLFHEGVHHTLRSKKENLPLYIEEPIANYYGFEGMRRYFVKNNSEIMQELEIYIDSYSEVHKFVRKYYEELSECDNADILNCNDILERAQKESPSSITKNCKPDLPEKYYCEVNNAFFLRLWPYVQHSETINKSLEEFSIEEYLADPNEINNTIIRQVLKRKQ